MTLKFRYWHKEHEEMCLADEIEFHTNTGEFLGVGDGITYYHDAEEIILMQFTGLLDRNSKEIFEGDVIKYPCSWEVHGTDEPEFAFVEFKNTLPYANHGRADLTLDDLLLDGSEWVVIGNIYENPDLLEN